MPKLEKLFKIKNFTLILRERNQIPELISILKRSPFHFLNFYKDSEENLSTFLKKVGQSKKLNLTQRFLISKDKKIILTFEDERYYSFALPRSLRIYPGTKDFSIYRNSMILSIKIFGEEEDILGIKNILQKFKGLLKFLDGSLEELKLEEWVKENLKIDTPRFKKMSDKDFIKIVNMLDDIKIKDLLKKLKKNSLGEPLGLDFWKEELNSQEKKLLVRVINTKLFERKYRVDCICGASIENAWFDSKSDAENFIKTSNYRCLACKDNKRKIYPAYNLSGNANLAIGFWLENKVLDYLKSETNKIYFSSYYGPMENDIVFILNEKLFLVSCKDSSIKPTDLYSLQGLKESMNVDEVIIVCPEKLNSKIEKQVNDENLKKLKFVKFKSNEDIGKKIGKLLLDYKIFSLSKTFLTNQ